MTPRARADDVLAWEELGDPAAPLALCLHGFPDQPQSFRPLAARLAAAGYRVCAPHLPGYHPSPERSAPDALALGRWAVAAADHLAPDQPACVVGHDWGAIAVYVAAALAPGRFSAAVTLAVPHPLALLGNLGRNPAQLLRSWYMFFFQLPRLPERALPTLADRLWSGWSPGYRLADGDRRALVESLVASGSAPLDYYRHLRRAPRLLTPAVRAQLARITTPTLILHGERDGCVGAALGRGQERFFTGAVEAERIAGLGHFLHLEAPDAIADRILAWLGAHAAKA